MIDAAAFIYPQQFDSLSVGPGANQSTLRQSQIQAQIEAQTSKLSPEASSQLSAIEQKVLQLQSQLQILLKAHYSVKLEQSFLYQGENENENTIANDASDSVDEDEDD